MMFWKCGTYRLGFFLLSLTFLSFFMIGSVHASHDIAVTKFGFEEETVAAEEQPRYPQNPGSMEILADAPWRVSSDTAAIPIEVVIKDAPGVSGCDKDVFLEWIAIYDGLTDPDSLKKFDNYYSTFIGERYWEKTYEDLTVSDFTKNNNNVFIKVEVYYWVPSGFYCLDRTYKTFTQYLRVYVGEELPHLTNWFCGDTHYHSEFTGDIHASGITDEVTEFGGNLVMTAKAAKAIGLDWTCVTDHAYYLDDECRNDPNNYACGSDTCAWKEYICKINNIKNSGFNMILGEEVSPRKMGEKHCTLHLLVYGTNSNYIVGDEHGWHPSHAHDLIIALEDVMGNEGFAFGAHPIIGLDACTGKDKWVTHLWRPWGVSDYDTALLFDPSVFAGFQFWNERKTSALLTNKGHFLYLTLLCKYDNLLSNPPKAEKEVS